MRSGICSVSENTRLVPCIPLRQEMSDDGFHWSVLGIAVNRFCTFPLPGFPFLEARVARRHFGLPAQAVGRSASSHVIGIASELSGRMLFESRTLRLAIGSIHVAQSGMDRTEQRSITRPVDALKTTGPARSIQYPKRSNTLGRQDMQSTTARDASQGHLLGRWRAFLAKSCFRFLGSR